MNNLTKQNHTKKLTGITGIDFLEKYKKDLTALPVVSDNNLIELTNENRQVFTTLLPGIAAHKYRNPDLCTTELIEEVKTRCIQEIEQVLAL
jgi:hypothetical protein